MRFFRRTVVYFNFSGNFSAFDAIFSPFDALYFFARQGVEVGDSQFTFHISHFKI